MPQAQQTDTQTGAQSDQAQLAQKVYGALKDAPVSDEVRSQAWNAFKDAATPQDFKKSFDPMKALPDSVKGLLWDFKKPSWRTPQGDLPPGAPMPQESRSAQDEPWYNRAILPLDKLVAGPKQDQPWYEQFGRGLAQGGAESGANLTSPKNLGIMGVMAGANLIPGVGEAVDAGASLLLGEEQVRSMLQSVPEIRKAYEANDWGKLGNLVGKDAASAFVTYKAGDRGIGKLKGKFGQGPIPDTTPAGSGRRPPPPPPGAPPTYPLIEAGTQKALGQGQPQAGPFNMPGEPGFPAQQGTLLPGTSAPPELPSGQQPKQLGPASQIQLPGVRTAMPMPGAPQRPSGILIEQGGHQPTPAPPGAVLEPASVKAGQNPTQVEPGTGKTPVSRQITEGSGPVTYEVALEHAKALPKEQLAQNIQKMLGAAMEHAERLPMKQRAAFLDQAKGYIKPFQDLLGEGDQVGKGGTDGGEPTAKNPKAKPGSSKNKAKPETKSEPKPDGKPESKPVSKIGHESETGPSESAPDPDTVSRVGNQLASAKAKGITRLKFTVERGENQKPLEIGVNTELDTPETLAAKIHKAGGSGGKVQAESTDPDHPLKWSFYVGGGAVPPGAR